MSGATKLVLADNSKREASWDLDSTFTFVCTLLSRDGTFKELLPSYLKIELCENVKVKGGDKVHDRMVINLVEHVHAKGDLEITLGLGNKIGLQASICARKIQFGNHLFAKMESEQVVDNILKTLGKERDEDELEELILQINTKVKAMRVQLEDVNELVNKLITSL